MPRRNGPAAAETETDETTRPEAAASSTASSAASDGFITDPGPEHDPNGAPAPEEAPPSADILDGLAWDTDVVKGLLTAQGQALHTFAGKADADWIYTRDELRAIAPPLTRILNRYDATRAAAATGDELALLIGLTGYVGRSINERRDALRAQAADAEDVLGAPVFGPAEAPADFTTPGDDELPETPPTPRRRP